MKRILLVLLLLFVSSSVYADTAFDSDKSATEVKLTPAINTQTTQNVTETNANAVYKTSIKEQKFNSALTNLDDAQVELREELSEITAKYNDALIVKENAITNCKNLKKEMKAINKKINNVEKSKKIISKNLNSEQ